MCGIIGILARPATRAVPTAGEVLDLLDRGLAEADIGTAAALISAAVALLEHRDKLSLTEAHNRAAALKAAAARGGR